MDNNCDGCLNRQRKPNIADLQPSTSSFGQPQTENRKTDLFPQKIILFYSQATCHKKTGVHKRFYRNFLFDIAQEAINDNPNRYHLCESDGS